MSLVSANTGSAAIVLDERRIREHRPVASPSEHGGEIESKPVDMHLDDPEPQTVHDQIADHRMVAVHGVAAAGVVAIGARVAVRHVVGGVVDAPERRRRSDHLAFAGVIEDDIEDDFDSGGVEIAHQPLELPHLTAGPVSGGVGRFGREERERMVAPDVAEGVGAGPACIERRIQFVEFHDRHQLHRGDPERLQVRNLLHQTRERPGILHAGRRVARECADVELVNDGLGDRRLQRLIGAPLEIDLRDEGSPPGGYRPRPFLATDNRSSVRIEHHEVPVERVADALWTAQPESVFGADAEIGDEDVPDIAGSVQSGIERHFVKRRPSAPVEEHERNGLGVL